MEELRLDRPADIIDLDLPWDVRQPRDGEAALRIRLEEVRTQSPDDLGASVEILTQIARAQGLQGKPEDAEVTLHEAEKSLGTAEAVVPRLRILLERGRLFAGAKVPAQAREHFMEVLKKAQGPDLVYYAIDAANMMSKIETPKRRIDWTLRALELAEQSTDARARRWLGVLQISVGWHHFEQMQYASALVAFEKAVASFTELGSPLNVIQARSFVGQTRRRMGQAVDALNIQKELLQELTRMGVKDGMINEEIGECLHALKKPTEAEVYFSRAYHLLAGEAWLAEEQPSRLKRLKTLGKVSAEERARR